MTDAITHLRAASACIDLCTAKLPRKAADYPHDVVFVVTTVYPGYAAAPIAMAFHADDASVAREYAKHLRRHCAATGVGEVTRRSMPIADFLAR